MFLFRSPQFQHANRIHYLLFTQYLIAFCEVIFVHPEHGITQRFLRQLKEKKNKNESMKR